jgi:hypothetical protein
LPPFTVFSLARKFCHRGCFDTALLALACKLIILDAHEMSAGHSLGLTASTGGTRSGQRRGAPSATKCWSRGIEMEIRFGLISADSHLGTDRDASQSDGENAGGFSGEIIAQIKDPDLELASVHAYNDWLVEEWSGVNHGFIAQCIVSLSVSAARLYKVADN